MSSGVSDAKRRRLSALEGRQKGGLPKSSPLGAKQQKEATSDRGQQGQLQSPAYSALGEDVKTGPVGKALGLAESIIGPASSIEDLLTSLLGSNSNVADAKAAIASRVQGKVILLDNPTAQSGSKNTPRIASKTKFLRAQRHMTARQHRARKSFDIPPDLQKHALYLPLQTLWNEYMAQLMANCSAATIATRFLTADLHGCTLSVASCKNPARVGIGGVIVRETENAFFVISVKDRLHVLPKEGTIFVIPWQAYRVTLHGNNLTARSSKQQGQQSLRSKSILL